MPIYEYRCENDHRFELIQKFTDDAVSVCEVCGAPGRLADRRGWISVKCDAHENWTRFDGFDDGPRQPA